MAYIGYEQKVAFARLSLVAQVMPELRSKLWQKGPRQKRKGFQPPVTRLPRFQFSAPDPIPKNVGQLSRPKRLEIEEVILSP